MTRKLLELETANGKASALAQAAVVYGDAARVNTDLAKLQAVTAEQIRDAMRKCIIDKKTVVLEYMPEETKAPAKEKEEKKS